METSHSLRTVFIAREIFSSKKNLFLTSSSLGYTFGNTRGARPMAKALSLKLDESTYSKAEKIRKRLKLPRNTYIRKAISHYNSLYARKLLEREYSKASQRLGAAHLDYLKETELLEDFPRDL